MRGGVKRDKPTMARIATSRTNTAIASRNFASLILGIAPPSHLQPSRYCDLCGFLDGRAAPAQHVCRYPHIFMSDGIFFIPTGAAPEVAAPGPGAPTPWTS